MKKLISLILCIALLFSLAARGFAEDFSVMEESYPEPTTFDNNPETSGSNIPLYEYINNVSLSFYVVNSKAYVSYFAASNTSGIDVTVTLYKGSYTISVLATDEQSTDKKYISGLFTAPVDGFYRYNVKIVVESGGQKVTKTESFDYVEKLFIGDVNSDGKITAYDARVILRYSAKLQTLSKAQLNLADIDRNSKVNASDARCALIMASRM